MGHKLRLFRKATKLRAKKEIAKITKKIVKRVRRLMPAKKAAKIRSTKIGKKIVHDAIAAKSQIEISKAEIKRHTKNLKDLRTRLALHKKAISLAKKNRD